MPKSANIGYYICSTCRIDKPVSEFYERHSIRKYPSQVRGTVCKSCQAAYFKKYAPIMRNERKMKVFVAYSGDPPSCYCCGETEFRFLTVDHINRRGLEHRKVVGAGNKFYYWLIRNNFPPGFRVACYNCNCCTNHGGLCPHEERRRRAQAAD